MTILAPLRGVTVRCFRETFAPELVQGGFTEAFTPFIAAAAGYDPLRDRELAAGAPEPLPLTPQFIGKDPVALRSAIARIRAAGYATADLNCGCPFPMVRNKGRGSGLLRNAELLRRMLEAGCEEMGPGRFSIKVRLGVERTDELLALMPMINGFPLRFVTVHARTARQMYSGSVDRAAFAAVVAAAKVPVVENGDVPFPPEGECAVAGRMIGRGFIRALGAREDSAELLSRYLEASRRELCGDAPVLGRMKELVAYWKDLPQWRRAWSAVKIARSLDELRLALRLVSHSCGT